MFKRLLPLLAAPLALAALASGCGQARDAEAPSSSPAALAGPLTKREFIARADAICERMNTESVAVAAKRTTLSPDELGKRALELQGRAIRQLRALRPPAGDERRIEAVLLHLDRLQFALRALLDDEGEDTLPAVAAIAVETDAVARAAKRYGLFRRCGAYRESPEIQALLRGEEPVLRGPDGKVLKPQAPRPPAVPEIRRLASALVPSGAAVLERRDCAGGAPGSPPCVTIELNPAGSAVNERRAEIARLAARAGWKRLKLTGDRPNPTSDRPHSGVLVFHLDRYHATIWLAGPDCAPQLQVGDGPNPTASTRRCVDTIMVIESP
jgi:hypothetical protein